MFWGAANQNTYHAFTSVVRFATFMPPGNFSCVQPHIPLGNVYLLTPPPPHSLGISIDHPWGGSMDIFWTTQCKLLLVCYFQITILTKVQIKPTVKFVSVVLMVYSTYLVHYYSTNCNTIQIWT